MPSETPRQQRFMGAQLAEQRKTGHNKTGMSEKQLREFASDVKSSHSKKDIPGQSLVDIEHITQDRHVGSVRARIRDENQKFANPSGQPYMGDEIPVKYLGPDTEYQAIELDPSCYGHDWDPMSADYYRDPVQFANWRRVEQYEYESSDKLGAQPDRFDYQRRFARKADPEVTVDSGDGATSDMYTSDTDRTYGTTKHVINR
jgi:hypothetical protein